ncbi:uncharacterized protein LOC103573465 [Microplitis demolitor]|uniref:uncharacterized protein LOC103573465 n=1 Tax=Microplitis demolitor TaxID=69319 RepID=UPI0004CD4B2D|nr:uncharacterized protein LOC103573465 [Microplitis demolitor]
MMMAPKVVGVLLKKPGQQNHCVASFDPQDTKIRGELYVEDLGERRMVSIRMGWLWVEGTPMRLALRALNLRQASPGICQPHALALGFTLSNSKGDHLATFWADTEPAYWSWVRAIASELVRQTPFRAQRCLNFLEILMICPRGPIPLPESPPESRRRSRSELRCWISNTDSPLDKDLRSSNILIEDTRRRARSELRCWSSSNSSDEDAIIINEYRPSPTISILPKITPTRAWGCSESSEGSDDSLPWAITPSPNLTSTPTTSLLSSPIPLPEAPTREQRIQRYKEARRRENEARSRRVLEEDARRRRARAEENNNNNELTKYSLIKFRRSPKSSISNLSNSNDVNDDYPIKLSPIKSIDVVDSISSINSINSINSIKSNNSINLRLPPIKPDIRSEQKLMEDTRNNNKKNNDDRGIKLDLNERRSRARERRTFRTDSNSKLIDSKERCGIIGSRIPISRHVTMSLDSKTIGSGLSLERPRNPIVKSEVKILSPVSNISPINSITSISSNNSINLTLESSSSNTAEISESPRTPCQEDVAKLLKRCQRVDHYVPVREKLTLFESLSRMGGRLARSTEDLGRTSAQPSPKGKQRARSLHDLNRGVKTVPVREMCRLFEGEKEVTLKNKELRHDAPCVRASTRKKHYGK